MGFRTSRMRKIQQAQGCTGRCHINRPSRRQQSSASPRREVAGSRRRQRMPTVSRQENMGGWPRLSPAALGGYTAGIRPQRGATSSLEGLRKSYRSQ